MKANPLIRCGEKKRGLCECWTPEMRDSPPKVHCNISGQAEVLIGRETRGRTKRSAGRAVDKQAVSWLVPI